jgi:uncharacterized protein (TIGR02147 family)
MPDIFSYTDFRKYLADYYNEKKATTKSFSYQVFSKKIGFKSKDFIFRVINRNKQISRSSAFKISRAIGHSPEESRYFENLVCFIQAKTSGEKEFYFNQLSINSRQNNTKNTVRMLSQKQLGLFSEWHHLAIRAIIERVEFKGDFAWLAKQLYPEITPKLARHSIQYLEKIDLICKDEQGVYRVTSKALATDTEVQSVALAKFYLSCTKLTANALENLPRDKRNISGLTLGISKKSYDEIVSRVNRFREEIAEIANRDEEADRVYQMQFALFPLSTTDGLRGRL